MKNKYFIGFLIIILFIISFQNIYILKEKTAITTNCNQVTYKKKVALTFDDGPGGAYTEMLLDGLKQRKVKATFFLVGKQVEYNSQLVARMYQEGHLIGNHTYSHVDLSKLEYSKGCEEINKTNTTIKNIIGQNPKYIRPPYGEWNEKVLEETNMSIVLWDVDPKDWKDQNVNLIVKRILSNVEDGDIILLHDIFKTSVQAALKVIDQLQSKGYEFVTVDKLENEKVISR